LGYAENFFVWNTSLHQAETFDGDLKVAQFNIVNRSPDGSTYFSEEGMANWVFLRVVEMVERTANGSPTGTDYISLEMTPVQGFPQLYFRLYGDYTFRDQLTSNGDQRPFVQAGSIISLIEVIDATGKVYSSLYGVNFPLNTNKTTVQFEPINVFSNSFRPGDVPTDVAALMTGSDTVNGTSGTEFLYGYGGNDTLNGFGSSDALYGGFGNDTLEGGDGADDLFGEAGNDTIVGYTAGDFINGGDDFDTWALTGAPTSTTFIDYTNVSFLNIEAIKVTSQNLAFNSNQVGGASTVQTIIGGSSGVDSITVFAAGPGATIDLSQVAFLDWNQFSGDLDWISIEGSNTADTIDGSIMNDNIFGKGGEDIIRGRAGNDYMVGDVANDIMRGGDGSDLIVASGGNDILIGDDDISLNPAATVGDDELYGGEGDDILMGLRGFNMINGDAGNDTVDYRFLIDNSSDGVPLPVRVTIDLSAVVDFQNPGASAYTTYISVIDPGISIPVARDIIINVENVEGSNFGDRITGDTKANRLNGWDGADNIYGGGAADIVDGGNGADNLWGGVGADQHIGGDGLDFARYDDANHGNLTIRLDAPNINTGVAAGDTYNGIEGLVGGAGNDTAVGNSSGNYVYGLGGNDLIYGQGGADYLNGGEGSNQLWGGAASDRHIGGSGIDYARYDDANWGNLTIRLDGAANVGAVAVGDTYTGIEGLVGGLGNDIIVGNGSNNYLFGGGGADYIDARAGNDYMNGAAGADRFVFATALGATNIDRIADFAHAIDEIVLSQAIFAGIGATLDASEFQIGTADSATDRIIYNNGTGQLFYDSNGNGAGGMTQFAAVIAGTVLNTGDFVMV
jgi:Ca2+-binding RTX toxin-like protein